MTTPEQPLHPMSPHEEALVRELARVMLVLPRAVDAPTWCGSSACRCPSTRPSCTSPRPLTVGCA
ncbi:hypothetical protein ACRAWF_19910 [Streptomyces sp. L7]